MDTIVACATPMGRSGIAVIRLSGSQSVSIISKLCHFNDWKPRYATLRHVHDGDRRVDQVLVLWMSNPNSFTGEDVVEISCHGNPIIIQYVIEQCLLHGARLARPGEFSRRAADNGKLSLVQAESLGALLQAKSRAGVLASQRVMQGDLEKKILRVQDRLLDYGAELEARLDHPDGNLAYVDDAALSSSLIEFSNDMDDMASAWKHNRFQFSGANIVIIGTVNAGKSSLFNHLVRSKRAIVSDIAGTTRDIVEKTIVLGGVEVCLQDTAGIRHQTNDVIEQLGMEAGFEAAKTADMVLVLAPIHESYPNSMSIFDSVLMDKPILKVGSFSDLLEGKPKWQCDLQISSTTGHGIAELEQRLCTALSSEIDTSGSPAAISQRQYDLCISISRHLRMAAEAVTGFLGPAVAAEEIVYGLELIADFNGGDAREKILDRLFSRFCIGK